MDQKAIEIIVNQLDVIAILEIQIFEEYPSAQYTPKRSSSIISSRFAQSKSRLKALRKCRENNTERERTGANPHRAPESSISSPPTNYDVFMID